MRVVEAIAAGQVPRKRIVPNVCAKIMTGAIVPEGADCVVQVEHTEQTGAETIRFTHSDPRNNICPQGEDMRAGDVVLRKGTRIQPQHIAMLATVGCVEPLVARQPEVGVIPTGNELVEPDRTPGPSQIRNSNGYQLCSQVGAAGAIAKHYGVAGDTEEALGEVIRRAGRENDVLLLSGGVSMGDFDLVPGVLRKSGVELLFEKVAVKPGMPTVFGVARDFFCFGLAGNPVSTFVVFEVLVKPFLFKLMGHEFRPFVSYQPLAAAIVRKRVERDTWMPVQLTPQGGVRAVAYHGPAHLNSLTCADGLICVPRGVKQIEEGTIVCVRQI